MQSLSALIGAHTSNMRSGLLPKQKPLEGGLICACQNSSIVMIFRETGSGYVLAQKVPLSCPVCLMEE